MKNDEINYIEIVEVEPWLFKVRSFNNRRKWYKIIHRRDESFWCDCEGFKYNGEPDKHIEVVKVMIK